MLSAKGDKPSDAWETSNQVICRCIKSCICAPFGVCEAAAQAVAVQVDPLEFCGSREEWMDV